MKLAEAATRKKEHKIDEAMTNMTTSIEIPSLDGHMNMTLKTIRKSSVAGFVQCWRLWLCWYCHFLLILPFMVASLQYMSHGGPRQSVTCGRWSQGDGGNGRGVMWLNMKQPRLGMVNIHMNHMTCKRWWWKMVTGWLFFKNILQ